MTPDEDADGVLWAIGDWTGGCALYARDGHLSFALNRAGDAVSVTSSTAISAGAHRLACVYTVTPSGPVLTLLEDDEILEQAALAVPVPMVWQHGGTMLTLGYDRACRSPTTTRSPSPGPASSTRSSSRPAPRPDATSARTSTPRSATSDLYRE